MAETESNRKDKKRYDELAHLWPSNLASRICTGFTDDELELLCDWGLRGHDATLPYQPARWLYWTAELYSFGRCYREWLGLPSWAPLPFYGDHGVCIDGDLSEHELKAKPKLHLTWFSERAERNRDLAGKRVLRIPHPWTTFRRRHGIQRDKDARGTLIFYAHSNAGIEIVDYNWDKYFDMLRCLPEEFHPLILCVHRHDVEKGYHREIRKYGIPLVSAGESSSPYFVDRFYDIIKKFKFATSNSGGSELFYCEELGVRYFLMGQKPERVNLACEDLPLGPLVPRDSVCAQTGDIKRQLFSQFPPIPSEPKASFVRSVLGLDLDDRRCKWLLRGFYAFEMTRHAPELSRPVVRRIRNRLARIEYLRSMKRRACVWWDRVFNVRLDSKK